jgi:hypothetical protein
MDSIERFRCIAELLADPALAAYKNASFDHLSHDARAVLVRYCRVLLRYCWALLKKHYGVDPSKPFCVVYQGSRYCPVAVTAEMEEAMQAALGCVGASPAHIAVVVGDMAYVFRPTDTGTFEQISTVCGHAESWLVTKLALVYSRPSWLTAV